MVIGREFCFKLTVVCVSGSLVMQHAFESTTPTQGSVLFGTVNGAVGEFLLGLKCCESCFEFHP